MQPFPTRELLPKHILPKNKQYEYFIGPIYYLDRQMGLLIIEIIPKYSLGYELLRSQISTTLLSILLLDEYKKTEEELKIKADELSRSNRELEQFAYIASHDLQEPLRKIIALGDRLSSSSGDSLTTPAKDNLARIKSAVTRMQSLINDLLSFSRVTSKPTLFISVDLNWTAAEVLSDLEQRIADTEGKVSIEKLPTIEADAMQMRQMFQNLISNALKFHKADTNPEIKVYSKKLEANRCELVFEDNGIGIEVAHYEKIFRVFERLHSRKEYEGSGIGLAICQKIASRHGGRICVESKIGKGTKFIVELPMQQNK
jgi:light-regulated signal transduction histidine kinase (bacteriophytochrome)